MADKGKYTCQFGALTLSVRETERPGTFKARVVRKPCDRFQHALVIRPGTVLVLRRRKQTRHIQVSAFAPRLQYGGRLVASGVITVI